MKQQPFLSIIIAYYNVEDWLLRRCIESVLEQPIDKSLYEIIVVDDGSERSPEQLLKSFNQVNIGYIHQVNQGPGGARNTGVSAARGKYIQFLDADDYLFHDALRECLDVLQQKKVDLISFDFEATTDKERQEPKVTKHHYSKVMSGAEYMLTHHLFGAVWAYIFKKEMLNSTQLKFTPGIYHEDEEFVAKLFYYAKTLVVTSITMYAYYKRPGSTIMRTDEQHVLGRLTDFRNIILELELFRQQQKSIESTLHNDALEFKINMLVADYIINMVRYHRTVQYLKDELLVLKRAGLYPLPPKNYSLKYRLFRILMSNNLGIRLLYLIEPFRTKI